MPALKNKKITIGLAVILFLVLCNNLFNISWGLPNTVHIYSYNQDEHTYLNLLKNLDFKKFDLNPDLYWKPHFAIYYSGFILLAGKLLGLYNIGDKNYYYQHPDEFRNIILFQRIFWGTFPLLLLVLISFFLGRLLVNNYFALFFAGITGFLPTFIVNSNYAVENILIVLFMAAVCYFSFLYFREDRLLYLILSGIFLGLAISTKQTGILAGVFPLYMILLKKHNLQKICRDICIIGFAVFFSFTLTSPFYTQFIFLKIFSPKSISPDLYGSRDLPSDIFNVNFAFIFQNIFNIIKINFIQTGGILFLLCPVGLIKYRKNYFIQSISIYLILFYVLSSTVKYATDSRLTALAYFLALGGLLGYRALNEKYNGLSVINKLASSFITISLVIYTIAVDYKFNSPDTRQISSAWIEKNILQKKDAVKIGLHENPWYAHPDIITREWMFNFYPDNGYYSNKYNEVFVIPELYKLNYTDSQNILPHKKISDPLEKIGWVVSKRPDYIVLMHEVEDEIKLLNRNDNYTLADKFLRYNLLELSYLQFFDFSCFIYKKQIIL